MIFENCAAFTDCVSEINNIQIDNVKDLNIVKPMYHLIEYSDNYVRQLESYGYFVEKNQAIS